MDIITAGTALVVGKKLLGKTFDVVSADIAHLYEKGRDKIIEKASSKISNVDDGKSANLRVTRDVFWNGSFTDESICAEYFGGILASSRSDEGKDDTGVYYVDLIKSLSSDQLKLHYLIYHSLNKYFTAETSKSQLNPGQESELAREAVFLSMNELLQITGIVDPGRDLHAIHAKGLIGNFQTQGHILSDDRQVPYLKVSPKALGIQLYAVAHNKLEEWRNFATNDYGDFDSIESPKFQGQNIEDLLTSAGLSEKEKTESPDTKEEKN